MSTETGPEDLREGPAHLQHGPDALEKQLAAEAHAGMPVPNLTALLPDVKRIT